VVHKKLNAHTLEGKRSTQKHPLLLDVIVTGVIGTLVGIFPEALPVTTYEASGVGIWKLLRQPQFLLVKLHNYRKTLVTGFPEGVIGLPQG
jgi:hypothetical protein